MAPTVSLMMVPVLVLSLGACGGEEPAETDQALADQLQDQLEEPTVEAEVATPISSSVPASSEPAATVPAQCDLQPVRALVREWNNTTGQVAGPYARGEASEFLREYDRLRPEMERLVGEIVANPCNDPWWLEFEALYEDRLSVWGLLANAIRMESADTEQQALLMADRLRERSEELVCSLGPEAIDRLEMLGLDPC